MPYSIDQLDESDLSRGFSPDPLDMEETVLDAFIDRAPEGMDWPTFLQKVVASIYPKPDAC